MRHSLPSLILFALLVAGCGDGVRSSEQPSEPAVAFDTASVRVETATDTFRLVVELAETDDQRSYGLMDRSALPPDRGMLFVYPEAQDTTQGFWMYRTLIPLDIAFLDADGRVLEVLGMEPCESPNPRVCWVYTPDAAYHAALEVNRGFFAGRGVTEGDRVVLERGAGR